MTADVAEDGAGLLHAAVLCGDPDELAHRLDPRIRGTLDTGGAVRIVLGRRGVRAVRDVLGDAGDRVDFPVPAEVAATPPAHRLAGLDGEDRSLLVGRVCADDPGPDGEVGEEAITLLLADAPATVLCVYDPDDPDEHARALRTHPWLLTDDGLHRNPDFRPPSSTSPVPVGLLGSSVATLPVPDGAALSTLRERVAAVAREAGLDPERTEAIVLAAHEAMLLASGADLRSDLLPGEHVLDVRITPAALVTECRGTPPSGTSSVPLVPGDDPRFAHLRRFCDHATAHADRDGRLVRVLTGTP
ncbi:hypothetical protein [Actinomycetospora sp. TBRC 11914]|uniref:hypothetical protein n=1 Tax=Actinomycetospora sp. TBRC 11914 TaxID=2729387 RepID=UPI00145F50A3|nr:hypothetical protein [Actinomycetospora sp. TBRC 11914]NMO92959.1 sensor histidine kinase [Actinomycetospora sp. TBRC 11914]